MSNELQRSIVSLRRRYFASDKGILSLAFEWQRYGSDMRQTFVDAKMLA